MENLVFSGWGRKSSELKDGRLSQEAAKLLI
jgi:hypothetical protein